MLSQKFEKSFLIFIFYALCANFSSVAFIVASESEFEKSVRIIIRIIIMRKEQQNQ